MGGIKALGHYRVTWSGVHQAEELAPSLLTKLGGVCELSLTKWNTVLKNTPSMEILPMNYRVLAGRSGHASKGVTSRDRGNPEEGTIKYVTPSCKGPGQFGLWQPTYM